MTTIAEREPLRGVVASAKVAAAFANRERRVSHVSRDEPADRAAVRERCGRVVGPVGPIILDPDASKRCDAVDVTQRRSSHRQAEGQRQSEAEQ